MAYAGVVSVVQILEQQMLQSDEYPRPEIESLYRKVRSLQSSLENIFPVPISRRAEIYGLEVEIRDAIYRAQDIIELHISQQKHQNAFLQDLQGIEAELDHITDRAEEVSGSIGERRRARASNSLPGNAPPSTFMSLPEIVGQEQHFRLVMNELLDEDDNLKVVTVTGLPGVGKTTLAKSIYDDKDIRSEFRLLAWVTVSEETNLEEILLMLIRSMTMNGQPLLRSSTEEIDNRSLFPSIRRELYEKKKFLIVIDDIWDKGLFDHLKHAFQDDKRGSRIIMTSRNEEFTAFSNFHHVMPPLGKETSWELLRRNVFAGNDHLCPPSLEKIGRKIAANCGGIPLTIMAVAGLLSQPQEGTRVEHWKSVEQDIHGAVSKSGDSYMEIISQSYNQLPVHVRGCFLYMGAFPEDSEIHVSKLINLWLAEGFLPPLLPQPESEFPEEEEAILPPARLSLEQVAKQCLKLLLDRNLLSVLKSSSNGQIKTCTMQGSLRKLALRECQREQFLHVEDGKARKGTESERRISVHKNILMCIQGITQSTVSNNKLARTLLYAGPNHHHPMPFPSALHLLRVLDAISVYFIELPSALFELNHLRYLSFTCDEDLPPEISELHNLLVLIVSQHPKTIFRCASVLPVEIWNLPQMRHLRFQEIYFADPFPQGNSVLLENLQYLSNLNAASCTRENVRNMPNLKTLKIWVEEPVQVDLNLDQLHFLDALKFTVLKPIPGRAVEFTTGLFFPKTLTKLSLSGCALPWEDAAVIQQCAPNLEVLKLRELAFQGEEWCLDEDEKYRRLRFLLLESLDLKLWDATYSNFPRLERLIIRHCYALEAINPELGYIGGLQLMELVHCSPQAVEWAEEVRQERHRGDTYYQLRIFPEK